MIFLLRQWIFALIALFNMSAKAKGVKEKADVRLFSHIPGRCYHGRYPWLYRHCWYSHMDCQSPLYFISALVPYIIRFKTDEVNASEVFLTIRNSLYKRADNACNNRRQVDLSPIYS